MNLNCKFVVVVALITCHLFRFFQVSHVQKNKSICLMNCNVRRPPQPPTHLMRVITRVSWQMALPASPAPPTPDSLLPVIFPFLLFLSLFRRLPLRRESTPKKAESQLSIQLFSDEDIINSQASPFPYQRSCVRLLKHELSHRYCLLLPSYAL